MGEIIVHLALAMICFNGHCEKAIVGRETPLGTYPILHARTDEPGYGGDVLAFARSAKGNFFIHRVWLLRPSEHRLKRLKSDNPMDRRYVSDGCINVAPEVYQELVDCCSRGTVKIVN